MKTLLVLRHAKSSWADESLDDHDRPLNRRGERAAPLMGRWAAAHDAVPDVVLCSTAVRARRTAELFLEAAGLDCRVTLLPALYLADPGTYLAALRELPPAVGRAMVVGHNPGLEDLVAGLTGRHERMPTAALAAVELALDDWAHLPDAARGSLRALWRPKEIDA